MKGREPCFRSLRGRPTRWWHGRYFVTVVVFGVGLVLGWQWEGSYLDWRCSPVKVFRYRGAANSQSVPS